MTKLVEEVVISPDVLVDVLVQVGFLDKVFEDGKVTNINYTPSLRGESTYNIKIEKEVNLKDIKANKPTHTSGYEDNNTEGRPVDEEKKKDVPQFVSPFEFVFKALSNEDGQGIDTEKLEKLIKERLSSNFNIK